MKSNAIFATEGKFAVLHCRAALLLSAVFLPLWASAASYSWGANGAGGAGTWDKNLTSNWFDGSAAVKWPATGTDNDAVFAATAATVNLASGGVAANDLSFNVTGYRLTGGVLTLVQNSAASVGATINTAAGVSAEIATTIAGTFGATSATSLTKSGAGAVILSGTNTFTGWVSLTGGLLKITKSAAINSIGTSNWIFVNNGTFELDGTAGNMALTTRFQTNAGTILNSAGSNTISQGVFMNSPTSNTIKSDAGSLVISGTINGGSGSRKLTLTGSGVGDNRIAGVIANPTSPNTTSLEKSGAGKWILSAANTYTGNTIVSEGVLVLRGNLQSANLSVAAATLTPEGALSLAGNLSLAAGSVFQPRVMPTVADRISVAGTVTLAGSLDLIVSPGMTGGGRYVLINKTSAGGVTGAFNGLPEGATFSAGGQNWQISYVGGDGNDVVLTLNPAAAQSFEARRAELLESLRGQPYVPGYVSPSPGYRRPQSYAHADFALRCFLNDEQNQAANDSVLAFCQIYADGFYYDNMDWMSDMMFSMLENFGSQGRIAPGRLSLSAEDALLELLWRYAKQASKIVRTDTTIPNIVWDFTNGTENLVAMNLYTMWHAAKIFRNHPIYSGGIYDDGSTPQSYYASCTAYFKEWLRDNARKGGLIEFSNDFYNPMTLKGLYNFVDFADDAELRNLSRKYLDLFWATWGQEQIGGVKGGGKARVYQGNFMNEGGSVYGAANPFSQIFWCYTGVGPIPVPTENTLTFLASSYRPSAVVADIGSDAEGRGVYTCIERKLGRGQYYPTMTLNFSQFFTRYTHVSPDYVLGTFHVPATPQWNWTMISSQNRWHGAIFKSHPDARIYFQCSLPTGEIRNYNQHWSVQSKNAMIVQKLNNVGTESTRLAKYAEAMKVWVATAGRTDLVERSGWVFASYGSAYAAIKVVSGGYTWASDSDPSLPGQWMVLNNEYAPIVLEVARASDYLSFVAFQEQILVNSLSLVGSTMSYRSSIGESLTLFTNYSALPQVNGVDVNLAPTKAYDSPFVASNYDSGVVTLQKGARQQTLDFNVATQVPTAFTWQVGNNVWDTSSRNWNVGTANWPNTGDEIAVFADVPATAILASGLRAAGLTFNVDTVLAGAPLALPGPSPSIITAPGVTARLDVPIEGWVGLNKSGLGTLVLAADNNFRGTMRIQDGTLQIGNGGTVGTPGGGAIVVDGQLRIRRSGALELMNPISGAGILTLDNVAADDVCTLSGANSLAGNITINRGTLRLTRSDALGLAPKTLTLSGSDCRLQLSGGIALAAGVAVNASSNSFDGGGILNLDGDNRVNGPISISAASSTLNIASAAGALTLAGNISASVAGRSLILGGESIATNLISGTIGNGASTDLSVTKQGTGTWMLTNNHSYTGPTSITAGKLILSGSLASDINVSAGTLALQANASTSGGLAISSTGRMEWTPGVSLTVGGAVTVAGALDFTAPPGIFVGTQFTVLTKTSVGAINGAFVGKSEGSTFSIGGYVWQISYVGGDGNDLVLTIIAGPSTALEAWRHIRFGFYTNTGIAADTADPDADGASNLAEFNGGTDPLDATSLPSFVWNSLASANWTSAASWNLGVAPLSNAATKLEFFTAQNLGTTTIAANNNNVGTFLLNSLRLAGSSTGTTTVNLSGGALEFRANGASAPKIQLDAASSTMTYNIANPLSLSSATAIDVAGAGKFVFNGVISGVGGVTRTGAAGTVVLAGNNTYQGQTTINAGTLQIGNDGATGSLGTAAVVNLGTLRFDRSGNYTVANEISGTGALLLDNVAITDTASLTANNSFSGAVTLSRGSLRVTRSTSLGSGVKTITATTGFARLELDGTTGDINLASQIAINISGSPASGSLRNVAGNNRIDGVVGAATGAGNPLISADGGALTLAGTVRTVNSGGRTLILGGASTAANTVSGQIIDGTSTLSLQKTGAGNWTLSHTNNTYTGTTTLNAGKLILSGALASDIITNTATFAPQGTPATTGGLSLASTSTFQIRATAATIDRLTVGGAVALAGNLDVIASPGLISGVYTIINKTSAGAVTGTFAGKPEGSSFTAGGYSWQISYVGGDGNDVVLTLPSQAGTSLPLTLSALETWRQNYFGITANSGQAANSFDGNYDGESNLLEFATGQSPLASTRVVTTLEKNGAAYDFTYQRNKAALASGLSFSVECTESLTNANWTSLGAGTVVTDGTLQTVKVVIPASSSGRCFVRLKIVVP